VGQLGPGNRRNGTRRTGFAGNTAHLRSYLREARALLLAGAIGSFKNPTSHRSITYSDPVEASEVVLLADLLMRILDSVEVRIKGSQDRDKADR